MQQSSVMRPNRRLGLRRRAKGCTKARCHKGQLDIGKNSALSVLDIGETGVRLVVKEPLAKDQDVAVILESPNHHRPLRVTGRVVWCLETTANTYCAGIQFDKRLPYAELGRLA